MAVLQAMDIPSVIRGHHISKRSWSPTVGELLEVAREPSNPYDRNAVAVLKEDRVVGHVPRELCRSICTFITGGGSVVCEVTGSRRYGKGLEVPCLYKLRGTAKAIAKLRHVHVEAK